jgi:hypothetical protein
MKVTAWTNEEYAREHYRDLFEERLALLNPNKKSLSPNELKEMASSKGIPYDEFMKDWLVEYEKQPTFIDEDRAKSYGEILNKIEECIIKHCKEKGIRFSADYHQYGEFGIPIIDDRFMYMGFARTWGYVMAMADEIDDEMGYLKYYLYSKNNPIKYPNEVNGEICV